MANKTVSRKEDGPVLVAAVSNELAARNVGDAVGRYLSDVEKYLNDKLPRDLHPSFNKIGHEVPTEPRPPLRAFPQSEPTLRTTTAEIFVSEGSSDRDDAETREEYYKEAESEKNRFFRAVASYQRVADAKYRTEITFEGSLHTWDEVLDEADRVACQYKDLAGFWGKIRKGLRKFGENHSAFDAWIGLLPAQSLYCSILCGGLKLVIQAAARLKDIRESVCDALSKIPVLLNSTKLILDVFKKSRELHRCSSTLYATILAALEHIVTWYKGKATKKVIKSLFKQDGYEQQLTEKVEAIKTASERFAEAATVCSYQKQDRIYHEVRENRMRIERSRSESAQNYERLDLVLKSEVKETRQDLELGLEAMLKQNNAATAKIRGQIASNSFELQNRLDILLECFLSSNHHIDYNSHNLRDPLLSTSVVPTGIANLKKIRIRKQEEALHALAYKESVPKSDIKYILRIAWNLSKTAQDRAVSLMQSPKVHAWIKDPQSSVLFVNGNDTSRQCPLSFVCAKLYNIESHASGGVFAHGFFCGQHLHPDDIYVGIDGMMRSLLGQLLVAHRKFELTTVERLQNIDQSNVDSLCEMYFRLIMQLQAQETVFCIIDAMTFHEGSGSRCREEALTVVKMLVRLTECCDSPPHCIFKVLLTCPGNSTTLYKKVAKKDVLWMPRKVGAQGGFTSMKWNASAGKDLNAICWNTERLDYR